MAPRFENGQTFTINGSIGKSENQPTAFSQQRLLGNFSLESCSPAARTPPRSCSRRACAVRRRSPSTTAPHPSSLRVRLRPQEISEAERRGTGPGWRGASSAGDACLAPTGVNRARIWRARCSRRCVIVTACRISHAGHSGWHTAAAVGVACVPFVAIRPDTDGLERAGTAKRELLLCRMPLRRPVVCDVVPAAVRSVKTWQRKLLAATSAPDADPENAHAGEVKYCIAKLFSNGVKFAGPNDF